MTEGVQHQPCKWACPASDSDQALHSLYLIFSNESEFPAWQSVQMPQDQIYCRHLTCRYLTPKFGTGVAIDKDSILNLECDVLIPASVSGVITEDNAHKLNCKVLAEAANVSAFFTKDAHSSTLLNSVKIFQSSHQYSCQTAQLWKQILATLLVSLAGTST